MPSLSGDDELEQVAASLDATLELVPYLPELLADLWDLGGSPPLVAAWLRELGLARESTRVLDLGCGKGAVSLTLARELGVRVHGVDLFEPFILDARARAEAWGLTSLCRFEKGELRRVAASADGYDVVIYVSVSVLGRLDECVRAIRGCVKPGGYMVIEEGCLAPGVTPEAGFEYLATSDESRRRLTLHGDTLLREQTQSSEETRAVDRRYIESIEKRAKALAASQPEDAALIRSYVERQERAAAAWERNAVGATWLLRKARGSPG